MGIIKFIIINIVKYKLKSQFKRYTQTTSHTYVQCYLINYENFICLGVLKGLLKEKGLRVTLTPIPTIKVYTYKYIPIHNYNLV